MTASRWQWIPGVIFAALVAGVCCLPLFTMEGNWYRSHEADRYLKVAHHFREAFQAGYLYPHWLPNLYGGFGYPTFIYYQPGFFFAALLFSFLFSYPFQAMIWTVCFFFFLGGCGAFFLARHLTGSIWFGLFGTLLFLFTPYVECNVYVRGDLSEFAAMMLTPWPLFFLGQINRRVGRSGRPGVLPFLALTLSLAAVFVTHPATALFYLGLFTVLVLACHETGFFARSFYWWVGLGLVSALVLSSPYWLTFWRMKGLVDLSPVYDDWYHPTRHLINFKPLFHGEWRYGGSPWGMPLHLGLPHFLLAVTGAIVGRRVPFMRVALFIYLGLVVAMTYAGYPLWKFLPLLKYVQFPWRLLSVIAVLQVVCACGLARAKVFTSGALGASLLLVLAVGVALSARNQFQFEQIYEIEHEQIITCSIPPFRDFQHLTAADDFVPRTVKERPARPRPDEAMVYPQEGSEVDLQALPGHSPYHIKIGFRTGADPAVVVIDQFGFPGMKVTLAGSSAPATGVVPDLLADGRMTVILPADSLGVLEAYYDGPPGWRFHRAAVLLWFVGLSGMGLFLRRRRKVGPDP